MPAMMKTWFPLLKLVPAEIPPYIPEGSGNPRQSQMFDPSFHPALRNGVSSTIPAVVGMLVTKFCPAEEGNDRIAAAVYQHMHLRGVRFVTGTWRKSEKALLHLLEESVGAPTDPSHKLCWH